VDGPASLAVATVSPTRLRRFVSFLERSIERPSTNAADTAMVSMNDAAILLAAHTDSITAPEMEDDENGGRKGAMPVLVGEGQGVGGSLKVVSVCSSPGFPSFPDSSIFLRTRHPD
jgi:hypothetical protein